MYGMGPPPSGGTPTTNGYSGADVPGKKASGRIYPHIDDILKAKPQVNINAPIRRLLLEAEQYSKQADTHVDFRRPDLALHDYINASVLVVDIIPRHKDFPQLKTDRGENHRLYNALQKRISAQYTRYEEVKTLIKANNAESGVQPASIKPLPGFNAMNGQTSQSAFVRDESADLSHSASGSDTGSSSRTKPVVQPKPISLLGKSILNHKRSQSEQVNRPPISNDDLESRFARLRMVDFQKNSQRQSTPIATQRSSINLDPTRSHTPHEKPAGPRPLPKAQPVPLRSDGLHLQIDLANLPRAPDAIYSPDRTNLDSRNIVPPRPSPRVNLNDMPKRPYHEIDGAVAAQKKGNGTPRNEIPKSVFDATSLKAEEVHNLMKQHKILFVDIRPRTKYDEGHIMSQYILCVEPVLLSKGMSADLVEERLVLAPDSECAFFQQRGTFDFMVYYDQSSKSNLYANVTSDVEEIDLGNFANAVTEGDYDKKMNCPPKLLIGGLDAWVALMGQGALATSNTYKAITPQTLTRPRPKAVSSSNRDKAQTRLPAGEESEWEKKLSEGHKDFAGRFPDISTFEGQQPTVKRPRPSNSMTDESKYAADHAKELGRLEYKEPARPPSALHRPSYRGDSEASNGAVSNVNRADRTGWDLPPVKSISKGVAPKGRTGLYNLGNMCYMNSILQAFSATDWLVKYFLCGSFDNAGPPPRKQGEMSDPPQLMSRNLAILLDTLWSGQYGYVRPQVIKNYIYRLCSRGQAGNGMNVFGGKQQQDAQEFLQFMLDILDDENNPVRDMPFAPEPTKAQELQIRQMGHHTAIRYHWLRYSSYNKSILSQKMAVTTLQRRTCEACGWEDALYTNPTHHLILNLPDTKRSTTIEEILAQTYSAKGSITDHQEKVKCDKCWPERQKTVRRRVTEVITRLPDTLVFCLIRNLYNTQGYQTKNETYVKFPETLDMEPYFFGLPEEDQKKLDGKRITQYRCYAVVLHKGEAVNVGHYTTLARIGRQWCEYDDNVVRNVSWKNTQVSEAYLLFYQRIENS